MADMTKSDYLALPKEERKRLAAKRSLERMVAKKNGGPIPPTFAELFGDKTTKVRTAPGSVAPLPKTAPLPKAAPISDERRAEIRRSLVAPERPSETKLWRTIRGLLHCTGLGDLDEYTEEARRLGLKFRLQYFNGDRVAGTLFSLGPISSDLIGKIGAILHGTDPKRHFKFGTEEEL